MPMRSAWKFVLPLLVVTIFTARAYATTVLSNDVDWRLAYILGFYAPQKGYGFLALDSEDSARNVVPYLLDKTDDIIIYEGKEPVVKNYEGFLKAQGFRNVKTIKIDDVYAFMFNLPGEWGLSYNTAVLVSDAGGEWILSAGPLAYASNSYIFFLNNRTKERILDYLKNNNVQAIYVVGYAGKSLKNDLPNATFISTGNRAEDSVRIANEMRKYVGFTQVYVMSGMYLYLPSRPDDVPIWTGAKGTQPILISYVNRIPESVMSFLKQDFIRAVIFIGPELDQRWAEARNDLQGKKVLSLFAVGYVNVPTRKPGQPYPLPVLFLPSASVRVDVEAANVLSDGRVFITLRNMGDSAGYVMPTLVSLSCQNGYSIELTPQETFFIDAKDSIVAEYDVNDVIPQGACSLYVEGVYGADADNMELEFNKTINIVVQSINDPSQIEVVRIVYSPRLERFVVYVKNVGEIPTYVTVYLRDVLIDGVPTELKTRATLVKPGETKKLYAKAFLTDADILDNPEVKYVARFGRDSGLPVHVLSGTLPLEKETLQDVVLEFIQENYLLVAAALVLIILLLIFLRKR